VGLVTLVTLAKIKAYDCPDFTLTRHFVKLSISPESSDGFASVGTILPKEEAALLPGSLFALSRTDNNLRLGIPEVGQVLPG
jgi:hypothetical protein